MLLMDHAGKSEDNTAGAKVADGRPTLSGWALIEDWMTRLDKGMVNDFNDDINTLLTFAGLFSAVVTGFLIEFYKGLQQDSTQVADNGISQVSQQLVHISQQLANHSFPPLTSPAPSPNYQPPSSIVWVNSLWFISLVLSLAAAIFGMTAKQWLREYLQWTTMSGPSEEQVRLRQGRYEAFQDWKTPAIIAMIPALLEIALILFLVGLELLLWTINSAVFISSAVIINFLIIVAIVATVLPAFCTRCPYKTPVGWACLLAKVALTSLFTLTFGILATALICLCCCTEAPDDTLEVEDWKVPERDWRERDLTQQTWGIDSNEKSSADDALALGRHLMLTRALCWIRETSQDQRLLRAVDTCFARRVPTDWNALRCLIVDFHIACEDLGVDMSLFVPRDGLCASVKEGSSVIDVSRCPEFRLRLAGDDCWEEHTLDVDALRCVREWAAHMLASDLLAAITQYNAEDMRRFGRQGNYFLQASAVLSGWFACRVAKYERRTSVVTDYLVELFDSLRHNGAEHFLGLKPLLPPLYIFLRECERWLPKPLILPSVQGPRLTQLSLELPPDEQGDWLETDCVLFVRVSQDALTEWVTERDRGVMEKSLPALLYRMECCARYCLARRWHDCGVPSSIFVWPYRLSILFNPSYEDYQGYHLPLNLFPHDLVDALNQCNNAGLITDYHGASSHIRSLLRRSYALQASGNRQGESDGVKGEQVALSVHDALQPTPPVPFPPAPHHRLLPMENPAGITPMFSEGYSHSTSSSEFTCTPAGERVFRSPSQLASSVLQASPTGTVASASRSATTIPLPDSPAVGSGSTSISGAQAMVPMNTAATSEVYDTEASPLLDDPTRSRTAPGVPSLGVAWALDLPQQLVAPLTFEPPSDPNLVGRTPRPISMEDDLPAHSRWSSSIETAYIGGVEAAASNSHTKLVSEPDELSETMPSEEHGTEVELREISPLDDLSSSAELDAAGGQLARKTERRA